MPYIKKHKNGAVEIFNGSYSVYVNEEFAEKFNEALNQTKDMVHKITVGEKEVEMMPVKSSGMSSIGYDEPGRMLIVGFSNNSTYYSYTPVLPEAFSELKKLADSTERGITGESPGSFFASKIKNHPLITVKKVK